MKRKLLVFSLFIILSTGCLAFGDTYSKNITGYFYDIKMLLDGRPVAFSNDPFVYNGTTYVSLRDASSALGSNLYWDENTKTIYIHSDNVNYNKDYEIASLKNQLKEKDKEIDRLRGNSRSSSDDDDLDDLEDDLEDDYYKYTQGYSTLKFDYTLSQLSNDDIRVKMYGDFSRTSYDWSKRDDDDFENFIEDICDRIREDFEEDIEIIVYDEDKDKAGEYLYDYSDRELDIEYEY